MRRSRKAMQASEVGSYQEHQWEKNIRQGGLRTQEGRDVLVAGVSMNQPLTYDGRPFASGSYIDTPNGPTQIYDGIVRTVDSEVFAEEKRQVEERERRLFELVELFVSSGSDALAMKYLGHFFGMLPRGGQREKLRNYLVVMGLSADRAGAEADALSEVDATPTSLRVMSELNPNYSIAIKKLKTVVGFTGIVFTGGRNIPTMPEPVGATPVKADGATGMATIGGGGDAVKIDHVLHPAPNAQ